MEVKDDYFQAWSDVGYPRPQLCRRWWMSLNGQWDFVQDPFDSGLNGGWNVPQKWKELPTEGIQVPYPPGSKLSGVSVKNPESVADVVWYRKEISAPLWEDAPSGSRILLNFEAVDYETTVWVDGDKAAFHSGGYTPFTVDLGESNDAKTRVIILRVVDRRTDITQPRGKQTWHSEPRGIWYQRSTGIWRDVWLEAAPRVRITSLNWVTDLERAAVRAEILLNAPAQDCTASIELVKRGQAVAKISTFATGQQIDVEIPLPELRNRVDWNEWLWSPDNPILIDASITIEVQGVGADFVHSYLGLRTVDLSERYININRLPVYVRGVLDQGYWEDSFFTAPSAQSIKEEVELIKSLGFNLSRVHERSADRRYLTWADRLGVMVWGESASTWSFNTIAVQRTVSEWTELVVRDRACPSIITWVPFNESWGVFDIEMDQRQKSFVEAVVALTRTLDPTRPVSANDGWEQLDTDIVTTHDYGTTGSELYTNYCDYDSVSQTVNGVGPQGRRTLLNRPWKDDRPVIVSEFGGIASAIDPSTGWGYEIVSSEKQLEDKLCELFGALSDSPIIAGFCYTQLTDTGQETNGLCDGGRKPKIPLETLRSIIVDQSSHERQIRPRIITESAMGGNTDEE